LLVPVIYVWFVNGILPPCSTISILFSELDYFHFELWCITVIFPHVTLKNMSEQVQTQSITEYWQVWSTSVLHKSSYVATPTAGSRWKFHFPKGQKKWWTANFWNIVMYWVFYSRWKFISVPKLNTLQLNTIRNSTNTAEQSIVRLSVHLHARTAPQHIVHH
jgi:hypothetical protein